VVQITQHARVGTGCTSADAAANASADTDATRKAIDIAANAADAIINEPTNIVTDAAATDTDTAAATTDTTNTTAVASAVG
jgi:hypothetical protein